MPNAISAVSPVLPGDSSVPPRPPHRIKFIVRPDREGVGEPVGHREHRRDRRDVPGVVVREAVALQVVVVSVLDRLRALRDLDGEIEHRLLPWAEIGLAMIDRDLVSEEWILGPDAQDRAMSDHAILALV